MVLENCCQSLAHSNCTILTDALLFRIIYSYKINKNIDLSLELCVAHQTTLPLKYSTRKAIVLRLMSGHWDVFCKLHVNIYK